MDLELHFSGESLQVQKIFTNGLRKGLIKKYWLKNIPDNLYGGIYFWIDKSYMEAFSRTELFKTLASHPGLENIKSIDFSIIERPTMLTRGFISEDFLKRKINKADFNDKESQNSDLIKNFNRLIHQSFCWNHNALILVICNNNM